MRRKLNPLHGVGLREFGGPPTHAVDSLDTLRKYIGPQDQPQQVEATTPVKDAAYWKARADKDRLYIAQGNFVRFASVLRALDTPANSPESQLRDELLSVLGDHGYKVNG